MIKTDNCIAAVAIPKLLRLNHRAQPLEAQWLPTGAARAACIFLVKVFLEAGGEDTKEGKEV